MANDEWETPKIFFDALNKQFNFQLDACASDKNHKLDKYYTIKDDALAQDWGNIRSFMNPPFSNITPWLQKATYEVMNHESASVVVLLPLNAETKYFHDYVFNKKWTKHICFIKGRLQYEIDGKKQGSPYFPSCLVIFAKKDNEEEPIHFYTCNREFEEVKGL